jgi:hypothetical protein
MGVTPEPHTTIRIISKPTHEHVFGVKKEGITPKYQKLAPGASEMSQILEIALLMVSPTVGGCTGRH